MREIKKIVIAGAGTMGASMGQTFAKFGYQVVLYDLFPEALVKAKKLIAINQETEVSERILSREDSEELLDRIDYSADIHCFEEADFVVEAILERIEVKHKFWAEVSGLVGEDVVLATNTSGLSITKIAEVVFNPGRFLGMHWINPPHIIPLIEVIKGEHTTDESAEIVRDLALKVKKKPVIVKDAPGFVLNRIQLAILRECLHIQERGIASIEAIDDVMKYGLGLRYACLGPFEVSDLGGLDVFSNIASYLFADLSNADASFGLLKECVDENRLGVKSGAGFYDYSNGKDEEVIKYRDQMYTKLVKCLYE
ncbi:3-hydroxyacyl-CoA dehydrogenase family protein [Sinanaerobacter chloroacetimidivorans]|uniref:3-hydroxybutyryl-CoA dehydrogenase n=1 Tax=Sinanaerobacter chloroacetimidivorans TaxID=2818044 RepID=A0A8J7W5G6_9FIRM|nr:3-hydroxyacyl-CoA dehydrogenase family protein [Sinanaerobacter chloroacetimidivorans]MBR0600621.1 3-hydroxyacyl-CoA dehydrogenase family protein [Sinanaerobacter chloroacetimidivorans]